LMLAVLVWAAGLATVAVSVRVACAPLAREPTSQSPVAAVYVPWLGLAVTKAKPAGSRSVTRTPVAADGPLSVSVPGNVTVSPTLGRGLLTVLTRARSASWGLTEAVSVLLAGLGSNWSLWLTPAVLACGLGLVTVAVMVRVCVAPAATVPTVQVRVAGS